MNLPLDPRHPTLHEGLNRLSPPRAPGLLPIRASGKPRARRPVASSGFGEWNPHLLYSWSNRGAMPKGKKGSLGDVTSKHCDIHLHGACLIPTLPTLACRKASGNCYMLSRLAFVLFPNAIWADSSFDNKAILIPTDLGEVRLSRPLCPSLSRREVYVLGERR